MKKIIYFLLSLGLINCTSDSDNNNNASSCINPPSWLHGTWVKYDNNEPDVVESKFVINSNNIIDYEYSSISSNWKQEYCNKTPILTTSEIVNVNYYRFTWIVNSNGQTITSNAYFIKQSQNNKMMFNSHFDDNGIIYTKL